MSVVSGIQSAHLPSLIRLQVEPNQPHLRGKTAAFAGDLADVSQSRSVGHSSHGAHRHGDKKVVSESISRKRDLPKELLQARSLKGIGVIKKDLDALQNVSFGINKQTAKSFLPKLRELEKKVDAAESGMQQYKGSVSKQKNADIAAARSFLNKHIPDFQNRAIKEEQAAQAKNEQKSASLAAKETTATRHTAAADALFSAGLGSVRFSTVSSLTETMLPVSIASLDAEMPGACNWILANSGNTDALKKGYGELCDMHGQITRARERQERKDKTERW